MAGVIGIIAARGGSKGLPNKNLLLLNGKELICHTIDCAKKSGIFDEIVLSTDSEKIAAVGLREGISVPFLRPEELASDEASSIDVVLHVLNYYEEQGKRFDYCVLLQPTSPLRAPCDLQGAWGLMQEKRANSVISVCEAEHSPLWMGTVPDDLKMDDFVRKFDHHKGRQKLDPFYRLNGAIYMCRVLKLQENKDFFIESSYAYIMPQERSVDIDSLFDFKIAECLMAWNAEK